MTRMIKGVMWIGLFLMVGTIYPSRGLCLKLCNPASAKQQEVQLEPISSPSFARWREQCSQLPADEYGEPLLHDDFFPLMQGLIRIMSDELNDAVWVGVRPDAAFFNETMVRFRPYVQKKLFKEGDIIAIHGDLHGDIHSLIGFIEYLAKRGHIEKDSFKIINPNLSILFLGDFVDRGANGIECLATIAHLKRANKDQVFLVRGNHETPELNSRYGLNEELQAKYDTQAQVYAHWIYHFYDFLPLAFYVGFAEKNNEGTRSINYIQSCHGGIELGFNPNDFLAAPYPAAYAWVAELNRADGFARAIQSGTHASTHPHALAAYWQVPRDDFDNHQTVDTNNGFMWNDFDVHASNAASTNELQENLVVGRSPRDNYGGTIHMFGQLGTQYVLAASSDEQYLLRCIFRAHQHSEPMSGRICNNDQLSHPDDEGVGKLWIDNLSMHKETPGLLEGVEVVTFSASPGGNFPAFKADYFGILTIGKDYKSCRLQACRLHTKEMI